MKILKAYALVDWHNLEGYLDFKFSSNPRKHLPDAILRLQQQIAGAINAGSSAERFRVTLRIYHGWHQDREAMPIRRDFELFANDTNMARRFSNISFSAGFQFGNELLCAAETHPIYATYRGGGQSAGQKMVDTSIVCDLLHVIRYRYADLAVVVADDDDFIPALLTAKAWSGRVILLRKPGRTVGLVTDVDCTNEIHYWRSG
jgi:hypothetical protein